MEQISKLLFALTMLLIFSLLLIYVMMSSVGNGGEYWGFSGRIESYRAASQSYDSGDYTLLAIDMQSPLGNRVRSIPRPLECRSDAGSMKTSLRFNQEVPIHGDDSFRLASEFSEEYNRRLTGLMRSEFGYQCTKYID